MRVTLKEVAALAGVSYQVVSAVLGKCSYARASEATRKKIFDAADKLGYVPNISARILQGRPSDMIGVLIDPLAPQRTFQILFELEKAAAARNCRLLISEAHNNPGRLKTACRKLQQYGVLGILALAHTYPGIGSLIDEPDEDIALVPVFEAPPGNYSAVVNDTASGIASAAQHLLDSGYQKVVMVTSESLGYFSSLQRIEGFRRIIPDNRIFCCNMENPEQTLADVRRLIPRLIAEGADGIVCYNDHLAALVLRELRRSSIRIPEDMGITGYDDSSFSSLLDPPLTSVAPDYAAVANTAFKLLEERIGGSKENVYAAIPPRLEIRESSLKCAR